MAGWWAAAMLLCGALASCSSEDETAAPLPEGQYPLQLKAEVSPAQTSAAGKDSWTGGEEIGVAVEGYIVGMPKTYVMDAAGNATPKDADNVIYWRNTDEARVSAWSPSYINEGPLVDISDQRGGYADFDVLRASGMGRYDQAVNLRFYHRMAKVEVALTAGEGITQAELEGADVTLLGDPEAYFSKGMVGAADQSDGVIKPYYDAKTKKYEAVVVPQDMTGKPLIRIAIDKSVFTYTPDAEAAAHLKEGKRYAYAVSVRADGIDVRAVTGATWGYDGEEDVASARLFKADELKVGDYFYSDGTWSDGGLRKQYADGRVVTADPKPDPVEGKTVVGIVFQTDPSRIGAAEKAKLGAGKVHGLVMCVKNAATGQRWNPENMDAGLTKCTTKAENYNDISGYGNGEHIRSSRGNFDNYPAFKAADDYSSTCPVPATTTGWFLPSSGQWWDMLQNLGGCTALADATQQTSSDSNYLYWKGQGDVPAALNAWMEKIAADNKSNFYSNEWFWSSSEDTENHARSWCFGSSGFVISVQNAKDRSLLVRPVLAF